MSYDPIVAGIGLLILAAMALLIALNPRQQRITPTRDLSWIDERIAAERDPARRTAWRTLRRLATEEENES
ncbi:hypothetical protein [Streptomyces wuyuanensis]|uniref:Uncharacterized protein n=1 Tax=Streptomyces wuyuanensis TaxID=1196353 RepID=A0A1G9ZCL3_9ACTN|nr:hypothetical protein [Streptomyces wuyuanensis]SDN18915.1 hypothetical protein SAMN05444921_12180 [Streptomyces wuyuanensis]